MGNVPARSGLRRFVGALVSSAIVAHSCGDAFAEASFRDARRDRDQHLSRLYARLSRFAAVDVRHSLPGRPLVFVIRDVHAHEPAQRNVSAMLVELIRAGVRRVGVEGTVGPLDFAPFLRLPRRDLVARAADGLLARADIGAVAHAILTQGAALPPVEITGLEEPAPYEANVSAYRRAAGLRPAVLAALDRTERRVDDRAKRAMRRKLLALYKARKNFEAGRRPLSAHLAWLRAAGAALAPEANALLEALRIERTLDFERAERERAAFVAARGAIPLSDFPLLAAYAAYRRLSESISAPMVYRAARTGELAALDALGATGADRALLREARAISLCRRLVNFSLTPDEWSDLRAAPPPPILEPFQTFYRAAEARDGVFLRRFDPKKGGVILAGGFHTPGLVQRLRSMNLAVVILTPRLAGATRMDGAAYLDRFFGPPSAFQRAFPGRALFLGVPEGLGPVLRQPLNRGPRVAARFARLYADGGGNPADAARFAAAPASRVTSRERLGGVVPDHVFFMPAGAVFAGAAVLAAIAGLSGAAALIAATIAAIIALAPMLKPFLRRHAAIAARAPELFGLSPEEYLRRLERRFWALGGVTLAGAAAGFLVAPLWFAPALSFAAGQTAGLAAHAAGNLLLLVPASSAVRDKAGTMAESMVPINLMDVGAYTDGDRVRYKNSLAAARTLLPTLAGLGFGTIYLYGGLWSMGSISREAHDVPHPGAHTLVSENGRSFVRVFGYPTRRAREQNRKDGRVFRDNNGNPFSPRDTAQPNTFLAGDVREDLERYAGALPEWAARQWLAARGNADAELALMERIEVNEPGHPLTRMRIERVEAELRSFIREARAHGLDVIGDFIPWRDPGSIDVTNYRQTFYRELPDQFRAEWEGWDGRPAAKGYPDRERALIDRIFDAPGFGHYAVVKIRENNDERLILVNHFTPGNKNVDQIILNPHHPDVQRHYVGRFERMMDYGFAGARVDLIFRLLALDVAPYFHQTNAVVPHDGPQEPLWAVLENVKAMVRERRIRFRVLGEVYNNEPEKHRDHFLTYWGANQTRGPLVDQLYFKDALETFVRIGVDPHWHAQNLWSALNYARNMDGRIVPFTANFDEHSLKQQGSRGRWAFLATLMLLAHGGMPAMVDLRELLFHHGHLIPVVGPDHPVATEEEVRAREEHSLATLVERSDVAAMLRSIPPFRRDVPIEWLPNSNEARYISIGAKTVGDEWIVAVNDFGVPAGQTIVTGLPKGFVEENHLPHHNDHDLNRRLAEAGYRLFDNAGRRHPLNVYWDDHMRGHRVVLGPISIEGPNIFYLSRATHPRGPQARPGQRDAGHPALPASGTGAVHAAAGELNAAANEERPRLAVVEVNERNAADVERQLANALPSDRFVLIAAPSVERRLAAAGRGTVVARADARNDDGSLNFARAIERAAESWGAGSGTSFGPGTRIEISALTPRWAAPDTVIQVGDSLIDLAAFDVRIRYGGYLLDLLSKLGETRDIDRAFSILPHLAARRSA